MLPRNDTILGIDSVRFGPSLPFINCPKSAEDEHPMTTNNKILTVSYGTFSCTLEGFDDNFGTMKAIAEYFRDLAGDDRYFGAEPPQPDVEMLARIAEREISRRVEARHSDSGLVLSAAQDARAVEPMLDTGTASIEPGDTEPFLEPASQDVGATGKNAVDQTNNLTPNDLAAVEETDTHSEVVETETPTMDTQTEENVSASEDAQDQEEPAEFSVSDAEQFFAQPSAEVETVSTDRVAQAEPLSVPDVPEPNSIAAKLQRIRAVVTQNQDDTEEKNIFEDEYAEDFVAETVAHAPVPEPTEVDQAIVDEGKSVLEQTVHAVEALQEAENAAIEEYEIDVENDDIVAALAQFEADDDSKANGPSTQAEGALAEVQPETEVLLLDMPVSSLPEDARTAEPLESGAHMLAESSVLNKDPDQYNEIGNEDTNQSGDTSKVHIPRARIIKVKRADIDAAIASGALEEVSDPGKDEIASAESDAEVTYNGDLARDADKFTNDDSATTDETAPQSGVDDDVSRLMAKADTQMEEPGGTSRRSAFAHLKAAVLAKKADFGLGEEAADKDGAYRSDLASVVKPRRPEKAGSAPRGESKRPAPLTLVAEQRVDMGTMPTGPVRPRRVATREEPSGPETGTSFEEYATERGAHDLPELLEAAASYLSFVEGREQFSRPQLMTKVRQIEKDDFSREDGLRSFGQLLRAGKIEKIKGGRFAVTGDIGYQPDQRAAG